MDMMLERSWGRAWRSLGGAGDGRDIRDRLLACYSEPQRFYHTLQHLRECIARFETCFDMADHQCEVEYALWFHDAVYDPTLHNNEAMSAVLAETAAVERAVPEASAACVRSLILATRHNVEPEAADAKLVADIDLSILAAPCGRFDEYERQIRQEYGFVPEDAFRARRGQLLRGLLYRRHVFCTKHFRDTCEAAARANLRRALERLETRTGGD